jgi:uncharacterized protein (TIGR03435 family)
LKFLIEWAYGIQPSQHSAGPSWIGQDRYEIIAKAQGNPTDAQMKLMLQALLEDRFHLKIRHESKKMMVYVISVGKTAPHLETPKDGETHAIRVTPSMDADGKPASFHVVATKFSLAQLTDTFARQLDRPIVNKTGMDGEYDFTLDLTPDEGAPNPLDPSHVMDAIRRQLGLQLKTEDIPVDFLVIDSAEKVAEGNS